MKSLKQFIQESLSLQTYQANLQSTKDEYLRSILGDVAYFLQKLDNFSIEDYLKQSLNITRDKMPQIPDSELDSFIMHFSSKYGLKKLQVPLCKLKPTQNEINIDKVRDMIKDRSERWKERKYLVSKNWHLADGHHDCVCGMIQNPNELVTIYKVNLPIEKMLQIMRKLKITKFKDVEDKQI